MKIDLTGKTALIGGASQGIGWSTAMALASAGAKVVAFARSEESLERLVKELPKVYDANGTNQLEHSYFTCDVSNRTELSKKLDNVLTENKSIEILICNTGGPKGGPLNDADEESLLQSFSNHVLVNSLMVKKVLPTMKENSYGRIINIISTSVKIPIANLGVSNTIRGAVASWAKTLSMELAADGITVNNVLPGYTDTPRLEALLKGYAAKNSKTFDEAVTDWKNRVPARRFAKPEETAAAVTFLASPQAGYINGVSIPVDGGRTGCL